MKSKFLKMGNFEITTKYFNSTLTNNKQVELKYLNILKPTHTIQFKKSSHVFIIFENFLSIEESFLEMLLNNCILKEINYITFIGKHSDVAENLMDNICVDNYLSSQEEESLNILTTSNNIKNLENEIDSFFYTSDIKYTQIFCLSEDIFLRVLKIFKKYNI